MRDKLKDLSKEYDKSENDLKALQSVGQVIIQDVYRVAQNFCGNLFLQITDSILGIWAMEIHIFKQYYGGCTLCETSISLYTVLFLNKTDKL